MSINEDTSNDKEFKPEAVPLDEKMNLFKDTIFSVCALISSSVPMFYVYAMIFVCLGKFPS